MRATFTLCAAVVSAFVFASCSAPNGIADSDVDFDDNYPVAFYQKKGYVISPYKPHNIIDVRNMTPGHLARDPSTAEIDSKTGKPNMNTAKIFRIPDAPAAR